MSISTQLATVRTLTTSLSEQQPGVGLTQLGVLASQLSVASPGVVSLVNTGLRGPKGDPGGSTFTRTAAQALGGHRAVVAVGENGADYASASDVSHFGRLIGITSGAVSSGAEATITSIGPVDEPSWTWTPGGDVYLGDSGLLTQTVPLAAAFLQRVGFALTATRLWVELSEPILL